jgi:hypothetical protein
MEVEEEFLDNAAIMAKYAKEEVKQFLDWAGKGKPYGDTAMDIITKLEAISADIKRLKAEYTSR